MSMYKVTVHNAAGDIIASEMVYAPSRPSARKDYGDARIEVHLATDLEIMEYGRSQAKAIGEPAPPDPNQHTLPLQAVA